jgi:hypothetical protein
MLRFVGSSEKIYSVVSELSSTCGPSLSARLVPIRRARPGTSSTAPSPTTSHAAAMYGKMLNLSSKFFSFLFHPEFIADSSGPAVLSSSDDGSCPQSTALDLREFVLGTTVGPFGRICRWR